MDYKDLQKANETIKTIDIQGKEYAEVNQRIKAFRMLYPEGFIITDMLSNENGVCVFRASVGFYDGDSMRTLGTGTAYEKEGSSFINKGSYIENCETSAVGRALAQAGLGIDTSVASFEEVATAKLNAEPRKASSKQIQILQRFYKDENLAKLLKANSIESLEDMPMAKASELIEQLQRR